MSENIEYGGPAFPLQDWDPAIHSRRSETGMSLRAYFAGQALSTLSPGQFTECSDGAKYCVDYADALIAELAKGNT